MPDNSNNDARIAVLEAALNDTIAYLKRLPRVPATGELIASIEARLAERPPALQYHGARRSAAGIVIVEIAVADTMAVVRTGSPANKAERLWEILSDGLTVPLAPHRR